MGEMILLCTGNVVQHGQAQAFGNTDTLRPQGPRDQSCTKVLGGIRKYRPLRHRQGTRTGEEESVGQSAQAAPIGTAIGGRGIAGRQDHQIGIKRQVGDLGRGEEAVIL